MMLGGQRCLCFGPIRGRAWSIVLFFISLGCFYIAFLNLSQTGEMQRKLAEVASSYEARRLQQAQIVPGLDRSGKIPTKKSNETSVVVQKGDRIEALLQPQEQHMEKLLEDEVPMAGEPKIPHIIHQTWDSEYIPASMANWVKSWAKNHPQWEFWFWTPDDVRLLIKQVYPDFLEEYNSYSLNLYRANSMRYLIMYHFGGIYADLDLEALKPLDVWTYRHWCILPEETYAHPYLLHDRPRPNTMITMLACRPHHPYFKLAIDMLPIYPNLTNPEKTLYVDRVYMRYNQTQEAHQSERNEIHLGHPDYFLPTFDEGWRGKFQGMCQPSKVKKLSKNQQDVCKELKANRFSNKPKPQSYTTHHWVHVVMKGAAWKTKNAVHIKKLVPYVKNITEVLLNTQHTHTHHRNSLSSV